jgi:hypothetical protein
LRAILLVFSGFALFGAFSTVCRAESPPSLESRVDAFLNARSESEADQMFQAIRKDPRATVAAVEEILQKGPHYSAQKVGDQVHLPVDVNGEKMSYALYVPGSYDFRKAYPLILCLHGMGFSGDSYLERWEGRLGDGFILACPTMEDGAWWTSTAEALVMAVLREVASRYHVDPDRVMLTGMSNGGIGTYLIGMMHADLFAAVSPMAAGIPKEIFPFLENFRHTGVYIIHGAKDQVMPVSLSRDIYAYFKKLGYPVVYREHDRVHPMAGGHFFPKEEVPALVDWFSKQRRDPYPKEVISVRDIDHLDRFYWTKINQLSEDVASVLGSIEDHQEAERVKRGEFARVSARIDGNRIDLETRRVRRITLYLHPRLVDLRKPVAVFADGKKVFEGRIDPDLSVLLREARYRHDPAMLFEAQLAVDIPPAPGR